MHDSWRWRQWAPATKWHLSWHQLQNQHNFKCFFFMFYDFENIPRLAVISYSRGYVYTCHFILMTQNSRKFITCVEVTWVASDWQNLLICLYNLRTGFHTGRWYLYYLSSHQVRVLKKLISQLKTMYVTLSVGPSTLSSTKTMISPRQVVEVHELPEGFAGLSGASWSVLIQELPSRPTFYTSCFFLFSSMTFKQLGWYSIIAYALWKHIIWMEKT